MQSGAASEKPIELKIAYVGGGSRGWARKLMVDLALCPDLCGRVELYDLDAAAARLNEQLGNWLQGQPAVRSKWSYAVAPTLQGALAGADFVLLSIQPGSLECMRIELAAAERHGLFFPVGDTIGAPGLVRGLRAATIYAELAQQIASICPRAWVINYTNPMTICTRTLTRVVPELKVFGCCHEVFHTQELLAEVHGRHAGHTPHRKELRTNVTGINHFTFIDRALYEDKDLLDLLAKHPEEFGRSDEYTEAEVRAQRHYFRDNRRVKLALFQRLGVLPAAGDRHLVEFLPGFVRSPEELRRWGIIQTPMSYRFGRWQEAPQQTLDVLAGRSSLALEPSGEEGVEQMRALVGLGSLVTNVNLPNVGQIADLPLGAVVETNAHLSHNGVRPVVAGRLPPQVASLVARHVANQELIVEAAITRDVRLAFSAIYNDPASALAVDEAWEMFMEMVQGSRQFLPGWGIP